MVNMITHHSGTASMVTHACNPLVKSWSRKGQDTVTLFLMWEKDIYELNIVIKKLLA